MAEVILVHGSCFGGRAWDRVAPLLRDLGHKVCAIDLPGRGGGAVSLTDMGRSVALAVQGRGWLIGHSAGGYAITMAAELAPEKVAGLIYVAGYVPRAGASVADLRRAGPSNPMRGTFRLSPDRQSYGFDPVAAQEMFFHDCAETEGLTDRLCLEPVAPQETRFAALIHAPKLPRAAIIATQDRAIPPDWQRQMAAGMVQHDLASGHCPQLSCPEPLAARIDRIIHESPDR
jgi:pimeloyl-ACP methyl ester carboxylesterase